LRGEPPLQHQIAAGPEPRGLLQRAVAEKGEHNLLCPGNPDDLGQGEGSGRRGGGGAVLVSGRGGAAPEGEAEEEDGRQKDLKGRNRAVPHAPALAAGEGQAQNGGPEG